MDRQKAPPVKNDDPAMRGERSRTLDGTLREKRSDTHTGTIEAMYGVDFGVRSDMQLGTLKRREGVTTLSELLEKWRR